MQELFYMSIGGDTTVYSGPEGYEVQFHSAACDSSMQSSDLNVR